MDNLRLILPVIIYVLLAILIVCLIVLVIRLIKVVDNADRVVKNVEDKVNKFNGLFSAIDSTCQALSFAGTKLSSFIVNVVSNLIRKDDENE